ARAAARHRDRERAATASRRSGQAGYAGLQALDDAGDRLAEADAHAGDAVAGVAPLELGDERRGDAGAGRAERMPERDAAPVRVHVAGLPALSELRVREELEHDRRERLVHFDHGHVVPRKARLDERALAG